MIWALVAASAVFWALRLTVVAPSAPPNTVAVGDSAALRGDLARLLGAAPVQVATTAPAPEAASRFKLIGVMAPKPGKAVVGGEHGVALIAMDGKPPKAYAVGARLDGELMLQSVSLRTASIAPASGQSSFVLELPPLPPPATGTLPSFGMPAGQPVPPVAVPAMVQPPPQPPPSFQPRPPGAVPPREANPAAQ